MQVKETLSKELKRQYEVTVPKETVEAHVDAKLQGLGKTAKVQGFREGKVPLDIVKKKYGAQVKGEVLEQIVQETSQEAIKQHSLNPATQPNIEIKSFEDGKDLEYIMDLEVLPEVPEIDYGSIEIEQLKVSFEDEDIDEALGRLAEQSTSWVPAKKGAAAADGHAVNVDFTGYIGDEAFEGGKADGVQIVIGSGQMIPGFEEELKGAKAGEDKEIKVTFPAEYHSADLAGKEARFDVKVNEVLEGQKSKVDDALATQVGFKDLDELRGHMRTQVESDINSLIRNRTKQALFDVLEEKYPFDVPEQMLEVEKKAIAEQVEREKAQGVVDPELEGKSDKEVEEEYLRVAKRRVELGIMFSTISEREGVKISNDELIQAVNQQAAQFPGQEQAVQEYFQKNPQAIQQLAGPILEEKVVDFILEKVKIKEKPTTLKALREEEEKK